MTDSNTTQGSGKLALPSSLYDVAKDAATIYLPATATLYFGLSAIWGWPYANEVTGSIAVIVTFLGVVLKISTNSFNNSDKSTDGVLHIDQTDPTKDNYLFDVTKDLAQVAQSNKITLKVNTITEAPTSMDPRNVTGSDSQN